jgi:hypothetical protein
MFRLDVLQNREVILTVGAGLVLVLWFFLAYVPMQRPRHPETYQLDDAPRPSTWREAWSCVPWILILVYVGTFIFSIIDITWKSMHPPNY